MCGIAGIFAYSPSAAGVHQQELVRIRDHMSARGPDGCGEWFSPDARIALGHRRLSIIDLSNAGAQPMHSSDGKLIIIFNGEIYNFRALRANLERQGRTFRTQSDTEVLLHLYAVKGRDMIHDLRGMFAFALWDKNRGGLLLARDPYGIKPLYYADDGQTLRFATQVKALLTGGGISREPDPGGWVGFHLFGSVPEPMTTYRAIRALPAGSTLWVSAGRTHEPASYFTIADVYCQAELRDWTLTPEVVRAQIREALLDSVRHHMVADVPVGIFLSAGVDSGAMLGLMREIGQQDIHAITLTYEEFKHQHQDEAPLAAICAQQYGSGHTVRVVTESEFKDDLPKIFEAMDQPTTDGINTWFASKAASEQGLKAVISGLGGDELLGGYPSFATVPRMARLLAVPSRIPFMGEAFRRATLGLGLNTMLNPKFAGLLEYGGSYAGAYFLQRGLFMPWDLAAVMQPDLAAEGLRRFDPLQHISTVLEPTPHSSFAKVATLESSLYMRNQLLRDTDWASMAHSIEVRVPLVDAHLLRATASATITMQNGTGKLHLAASPRDSLPTEIANRPKTGFGTPVHTWLQRDKRLQAWRAVPQLAARGCPWARRWAYQSAAA